MWIGDYLHTVCDFEGPDCTLACNQESTYKTLDAKTICFTRLLKQRYRNTEFFIKLDDDALVDRQYVYDLMQEYRGYSEPVYISHFILNLDPHNLSLNGSYYGNGKFYMFNRALLDCIDTNIEYVDHRNEDAVFGAMVHNGCGPDFFIKLDDDALVDKEYVFGLVKKYRGLKQPLYISDFSTYHNPQPLLDGTRYGNGKFYMFNRKLLDCIADGIEYRGNRNEDAIFGALVRHGCGDTVKRVPEDNSKIWHKSYQNKDTRINLAALSNH
ncbi:hypothetical protein GGI07_003984 [Coemansia sp. Benny D115]|nr:hypothetical protein GGI07_003984 [Coemansia sp. Benny D115]